MYSCVDVQERSVWGIDCYTRTSVELVLELTLGLSKEQSRVWITKTLLPALNRQNGARGVDMLPAVRDLCKVRKRILCCDSIRSWFFQFDVII